MTRSGKSKRAGLRLFLLAACAIVSACSNDNATDYCKNHDLFHDNHRETVGILVVNMTDIGLLVTNLTLPYSIYGHNPSDSTIAELERTLREPQNVYNMQTADDCERAIVNLSRGTESVNVHYESSCGENNKLGQLDFALFDTVSELDEIDVVVTTAAVSKHFLISRQCDSAIFRLD